MKPECVEMNKYSYLGIMLETETLKCGNLKYFAKVLQSVGLESFLSSFIPDG